MTRKVIFLTAALALTGGMPALAQPAATESGVRSRSVDPRSDTLDRLLKPITIELTDARLEDVVSFIENFSGIDLRPMWEDERFTDGLQKDARLSVKVDEAPVLELVERVLEEVQSDFSENSWQINKQGQLEVGPKVRLNRYKERRFYDINDLLFEIPDFASVPELDLDQVLQQSQQGGGGGGGGGGGSIFDQDDQEDITFEDDEDAAQRVMDIIRQFVETEQWQDNGGDGGQMRYYNGTIIIQAPDYIHRQINGYPSVPQYRDYSAPRVRSAAATTGSAPAGSPGNPAPPAVADDGN
ncbi:MAG: hypothetical protein R3B46_13535 [Phycisphaerales bacterium]